ncbi:glycosyltransferase family 4 protein [Nocardioides zeae]|uniref:Glycosyltransferase family 4 protein n=1 Tax=Nocardioides imazamoxiresistens TaxID=3231893 RepID=A0ABU3PTJ3_9ACTN|nr:glycosyltransferase family 4 protein [Nocardioides zeae]MDT9592547.1 glycosyltransferase family 4 protein [Nocardioides zeae]
MRILVYPHAMELGGSQLNALDLAGALQARGHEVVVYSQAGELVDTLAGRGLEHVLAPPGRSCPSAARVAHLRRVLRSRCIDVVHGYEWPPVLEAGAACVGLPTRVVATVLSMSVAPFLPEAVPLVVGTERIRASCVDSRSGPVVVIEPPVDVLADRPGAGERPAPVPGAPVEVAVVCRLVPELKLEGLLTAVDAVGDLPADVGSGGVEVRLTIAGDGPARGLVQARADAVNERCGRPAVRLLGAVADPRPVYDRADVAVGMGGSALRSIAFARPLVVQGESGFFELLEPRTLPYFLDRGFYGVGDRGPEQAREHLAGLLADLAGDPARRATLGEWGRDLAVRRFSLERAAALLEGVYALALDPDASHGARPGAPARTLVRLADYKLRRHGARLVGRGSRDDFNARPV